MPLPRRRHLTAAALALIAGRPMALGALLSWNAPGGGPASTSTNWSPNLVPTSADDLTFNLAATYAITFNASTAASRTQTFRQGTVTLTMSSPHATSTGITVGDLFGDVATATLTTGAWNCGGPIVVGNGVGANGTLNVNDDDADLLMTGTTSDMTIAGNAPGTLSVTGGGLVQVADQFIAGSNATGTSTVTVSGTTSLLPIVRSTLSVLGTGASSKFGQGGDATVNISNGALAAFAGDLVVSNGSASNSTVTVAGLGGLLPQNATLDVAGDLLLGENVNAGAAAGVATLNANADGRVFVGGTLSIGNDAQGGTGTLNINAGALVQATSVINGTSGTINHTGGTLRINGGTYTGHADPLVVTGTGAPTLQLSNNLSKTLAPAGAVGLIVGDDTGVGTFTGDLVIDSGADLILSGTSKDIQIGDDAGTTGTITVTGAGSRLVADQPGDDIRVGVSGTGTLNVDSGGQLLASNILVPATALGGRGDLNIGNTGAATVTTGNLTIGSSSGPLPVSEVAVLAGTLNVTNPGIGIVVRDSGILLVNDTLHATGTVLLDAGELQPHGTVTAGLVDVDAGGLLRPGAAVGPAIVDAPVRVRNLGVLEVLANDLTIGKATDPNGFEAEDGSTITVGARRLTLLDADRAITHVTTINGGEIVAPNGMEIVTAGVVGTLDGTGTITTSELFMFSGGSVITATGANGITINGKFHNSSGLIDGTKYTFNNNPAITDSGWTGAGTINAQVVFNSGTKVNALANMTMGVNLTTGVTFNLGSELHADTRTVTLIDSNGVALGSVTDLSGGHVVCAQNLTVNNGRRLSGRGGSIDCPTLTINGVLAPGELVGVIMGKTGELTVNANLVLQANADTNIEIQGVTGPLEYDRVVVNGAATLAGNLNVSYISGFSPTQPFALTILQATSISGSYSAVTLPPRTLLRSTATQLTLVFCPADFNLSGTITVQDIFDFLAAYFGGNPLADFNQSGTISVQDIFDFLAAYFAGCP